MQLNGLTRLLDTWTDRPVKLLYLLNARALPLTSKLPGSRQSKIIKQGASGRNGLTYTTKKNISKLTCLPVLFWWVCRSPCLLVLFWWVCLSPSACGREAIIHLKVNYRYKRVQMVHILNKYVEYQCTVIPTLSP